MPREHLLKIGVSGIRGVVGDFLTPGLACAFAQAFGTYVGAGRVVVGRDTRSSGEMLHHAVACGLLAAGCEVVDVGILPTPTIQIYVGATRARGGIAITASHNPPEYNALKLFNSDGLFFNSYERGELIDLYHQSDFRRATNEEIRRATSDYSSASRLHIERVLRHVDADRIRRRGFRVALDAVNGAGAIPWAATSTPFLSIPPSPSPASPNRAPIRSAICPTWCAPPAPKSVSRRTPMATASP
jgi:phosphomannomutase